MSRVTRNIIANFTGRGASLLIALIVTPLYIRLLGIESYGLVGFYVSLHGVLSILDLGLSATLSRQIARLSAMDGDEHRQEMRDLVYTFGLLFVSVSLALGAIVVMLSSFLAEHWVRAENLPPGTVAHAVALMGLVFALQWPFGLFFGALMSLQHQTTANAILGGTSLFRALATLAALRFISPTIEAFFLLQAVTSGIQAALAVVAVRRLLPKASRRARFRKELFREHWRYAAGTSTIAILASMLFQADKIVASKVLTLKELGYYGVATLIGNNVANLVAPVYNAYFPRYCQALVHEPIKLPELYHRSAQTAAVLLFPTLCVLTLFSGDVLWAWTGDVEIAQKASGILTLIALGTAMNSLRSLPYGMQLAHGWTRLIITVGVLSIFVIVPLEWWGARMFGGIGAAAGWSLLNAGYLVFEVPAMHRRILRGEQWQFYLVDIGLPLLASLCVTVLARVVVGTIASRMVMIAVLGLCVATAMVAAALAAPYVRASLRARAVHWLVRAETPPPR